MGREIGLVCFGSFWVLFFKLVLLEGEVLVGGGYRREFFRLRSIFSFLARFAVIDCLNGR